MLLKDQQSCEHILHPITEGRTLQCRREGKLATATCGISGFQHVACSLNKSSHTVNVHLNALVITVEGDSPDDDCSIAECDVRFGDQGPALKLSHSWTVQEHVRDDCKSRAVLHAAIGALERLSCVYLFQPVLGIQRLDGQTQLYCASMTRMVNHIVLQTSSLYLVEGYNEILRQCSKLRRGLDLAGQIENWDLWMELRRERGRLLKVGFKVDFIYMECPA